MLSGPSLLQLSWHAQERHPFLPQTPDTLGGPRPSDKDPLCHQDLQCLFPLERKYGGSVVMSRAWPQNRSQTMALRQSCDILTELVIKASNTFAWTQRHPCLGQLTFYSIHPNLPCFKVQSKFNLSALSDVGINDSVCCLQPFNTASHQLLDSWVSVLLPWTRVSTTVPADTTQSLTKGPTLLLVARSP